MKRFIVILAALFSLAAVSCDLLSPGNIINPNVDEDTFLNSANSMQAWVNGTNRSLALASSSYCELMEILSDNYFNNYTRSSKVFDIPKILYTDIDVTNLQRHIGTLREAAEYGISKVAPNDPQTSREDLFNLYWIKGYSFILAGDFFVGLPASDGSEAVSWKRHLEMAVQVLEDAAGFASSDEDKAFAYTLQARAYHRLGDKANARAKAAEALEFSPDFVRQVQFDAQNGVTSFAQTAIWGTMFQPLPRLDFLDPKYFQTNALEERPITIAKAEENHLILAEAMLSDGDIQGAARQMTSLLSLVGERPVQSGINDQLEGRFNGGFKQYPNSSEYRVAASQGEELRSGLVLDRHAPNLIDIPYISGTSVTEDMIAAAAGMGTDALLEVLYLMRQEIFFAEGRRPADLGIRLPLCEVEAAGNTSAQPYIHALIPEFIPLDQGMDDFTMDEDGKTVTIKYNMNKIIVANKSSEYVVPMFN